MRPLVLLDVGAPATLATSSEDIPLRTCAAEPGSPGEADPEAADEYEAWVAMTAMPAGKVAYSSSAWITAAGVRSSAPTPLGYRRLKRDPPASFSARWFWNFICWAVPLSAP